MSTTNEKEDPTRELMPLVYQDLRKLARRAVVGENDDPMLGATMLVHEAYIRLLGQRRKWRNRAHFFAIAGRVMRRVLVDHARRRQAGKRGGELESVPFDESWDVAAGRDAAVIALDEALATLRERRPRSARVVELRYFAGATIDETAEALGVSTVTVEREWRAARTWLHRELVG